MNLSWSKKDMLALQKTSRDCLRWQKAQEQLLCGQLADALPVYRILTKRYPQAAELWFELGNIAAKELDFKLANASYRRAVAQAPRNASLLGLVGHQFVNLRQLDDARSCYESAVAAEPDSVDARMNLAVWFERERRLDDAWEHVQECLSRHPRDDQARYFRALLLHRKKKNDEAESALRDLIKDGPSYPYVKYAAPHLLGVVLDQLGQPEQAMRSLLAAKAQMRTITDTVALERTYDIADQMRRWLLAGLTPEMIRRWRQEQSPPLQNPIAFLGGHPRSGTTLLEQVLDANPGILAFDESRSFHEEIENQLRFTSGSAPSTQLDVLPTSWRNAHRERYLQSLIRGATQPVANRMLLDKNPSLTMSLNILLRVIPDLKVIIALRDPRDVVISCFFQNMMLNATNVNFLSIERTVKHYGDLMDVWLRMRELGGFDWIESRYEDVVTDVEKEGHKVTEFLGLPWHSEQGRSYENARRKVIYAPTYHDVTEPVYSHAVGRWERYAAALEPVRKKLEAYCRQFGYTV